MIPSFLKKYMLPLCLCCLAVMQTYAQTPKVKVLVYTKNGTGYIHDNRAASVKCIQALGAANGFKVDTSNNAAVFTEQNLRQYTLLIFSNTNNDVFDTNTQRLAFRRYIEGGGGFVGLHSVMGTERNWTWFKQLIGGTFSWHAIHQKFMVKVIDPSHPTVKGWPLISERPLGDECYFTKEFYPGIKVTMAHDITTLLPVDSIKIKNNKGSFGNLFPAEWYQSFDGGNVWITTLGHDKEYYQQADFSNHILAGIKFVLAQTKASQPKKAYATSWNEALR
nr:ThuA domain-containing protein [uncultured Mucilaginibacter sp.]